MLLLCYLLCSETRVAEPDIARVGDGAGKSIQNLLNTAVLISAEKPGTADWRSELTSTCASNHGETSATPAVAR
jgi:hypothetical protein